MAGEPLPAFPHVTLARLGDTRWRAPGAVQCVRLSHDFKAIAAAVDVPNVAGPNNILLYDTATGQCRRELGGHEGSVQCLDYSPDGGRIATCGYDGAILIWGSNGKVETRLFHDALDSLDLVMFSRDGTLIISAHQEPNVVRTWDWRSRREIARTAAHRFALKSVAITVDGRLLSTSCGLEAIVWDAHSGTRIREFDGDALTTPFDRSKTVVSVGFSGDAKQLIVVRDQSASHYDIDSGERRLCLPLTPGRYVGTFTSTVDGRLWALGTFGERINNVEIWDANRGERLHELTGHTDLINSLDFSRDGKALVSGSNDHTIRLWDVESGNTSFAGQGHQHVVRGVCFADDAALVSVGNDGRCRCWDVPGAAEQFSSRKHTELQSVVIDRARRVAFVGEESGSAEPSIFNVLDVSTGKEVGAIAERKGSASVVAFAARSGRLFTTSYQGAVRIWDTNDGELLKRFGRFKDDVKGIYCLAVSPDEKTIAIGCGYGVIEVWSLDEFEPIHDPLPHGDEFAGAPSCVSFSPDGSSLATGGEDGAIRVWRTSDYALMGEFSVNQESINGIAFSPDGRLLASAGNDGLVRLWDIKALKEVCTLTGHAGVVTCVGFSPNGKLLASGSYDTTILIWDVDAAVADKK